MNILGNLYEYMMKGICLSFWVRKNLCFCNEITVYFFIEWSESSAPKTMLFQRFFRAGIRGKMDSVRFKNI